jgi:hypothetical protein
MYSAAFEQPRGFAASCETFFGSRQSKIDGGTLPPSIFFHLSTIHKPFECSQLCYTGEKLLCLVSVESFEFLTLSKICFTYDGPYNCVKK